MISHYFKLARKALGKNKYYTVVNVFGLVFGMLSALIIAKYIGGSLQFDNFHEKKDRIYSIAQDESINGSHQKSSLSTYWGVGDLVNQFPEVVSATRCGYHIESLVIAEGGSANSVSFFENKIFSVDSAFFDIFTFPFIHGNPRTALSRANLIVITSTASQRYFGNSNPVGKTLTIRTPWGAESTYEVTGVMEDIPRRSQFNFDFLITQTAVDPNERWLVPDAPTFLLLKGNADISALTTKLTRTLKEVPELKASNRVVSVSLKSLAKVELSNIESLLLAVGIFIVLISWVNYINQVIAQSYFRMKEIGILRVVGASRVNLKTQFVVESGLICLISLILIVGIYLGLEPSLQSLTNGHLLPLIGDPTIINLAFLAIFIIGVTLAAAVPTVILFAPNFGETLRNAYSSKVGGVGLRQLLAIVQFSVSTILMISVFVISNQLEYMEDKDKGINMQDVVVVQAPIVRDTTRDVKKKTLQLFKDMCAELPFVVQAASSTNVPSEEYRQETYLSLEDNSNKSMVHQNGVDSHFFDLYEVKFIAGHNFNPETKWKNANSIILNESAARALGIGDFDKMINAKITDQESGKAYDLIGIVNDYHQTSLKYQMRPIAFKFNETRGHFSLKINRRGVSNSELEEKFSAIKQIWRQTYHDASFEYFFLADKFADQDRQERYFGKLFNYFTVLSIIISCLGLFGLSLLISSKRQREIGVRKVFGATALDILVLFLKSYLAPLSVAVAIGSPIAYQLMNTWLRTFAYRIEIGMEVVSLAWLGLTVIFLLTVSYHTLKSAIANPVTILKD